ncbi:MAG: glycoside hydrolase family 2 protein, partial [Chitinophagaceae bacterium]
PQYDAYQRPGSKALLQHFDGMERNFENSDFEHVAKWMLEKGYGFDFFSDRQLQKFNLKGNSILTGGNSYQTILLPANKLLTNETMQKLVDLAKGGATILVYKAMPTDVPGWGMLAARREAFQKLLTQLSFKDEGKLKKALVGKGAFIVSNDLDDLIKVGKARREEVAEKGLSYLRRKNDDGTIYFINNRSDKAVNEWVQLNATAAAVALYDPMVGKMGLANRRKTGEGMEVQLQLEPHGSVIVQTYKTQKTGTKYPYVSSDGDALEIGKTWTVEFLSGGPVLPKKYIATKLESWTEASDEAKSFSGTAKYSTSFQKPTGNAGAWLLNLGKVHETAEVFLNGKKLATLVGPSFQVTISSSEIKATNKLEIVVANLMANRIIYMDKNGLPWKIFYNTNMPARRRENAKNGIFDASDWKPLPSGLLGPVTLTPLKYE